MKKTFTTFLVALGFTTLLIGCSNVSEPSASNDSSEQTGENEEPVTIQMTISGSEEEQQLRKETADLFMEQNPHIKIEWIDIGADRYQKTMALLSGGQVPDILYVNDMVAPLAERGLLKPLDELIEGDSDFDLNDFYPALIDVFNIDGQQYALPQEISPHIFYYNKDLFEQEGVPLPHDDWTQEEFLEAAKQLTDPDKKQYGFVLGNDMRDWTPWLLRNGGRLFSSDYTQSGFDTPEGLEALQIIEQIAVTDRLTPSPAEAESTGQNASVYFRNQQAAMIIGGLYWLPPFKAEPLTFEWDVVMAPKADNQEVTASILAWAITEGSEHPEEAWEVLKFFVGHEGMKVVAEYNMALPAIEDAEVNQIIADSGFPENVQAFIDSASVSVVDNFHISNWNEVHEAIKVQMELLMLGNQSVTDTQQNITSDVNELLSE